MVNIYAVNIRTLSKEYITNEPQFDSQRIDKLRRLRQTDDKLRCIAGGLLINKYVIDNINQIKYNSHGKPYTDNGKQFNITHSGDYVLCAVGEKSLGIDMEKYKQIDFLRIADFVCTEKEMDYLRKSDNLEKDFYLHWTFKECYMKATGNGFSMSPKSFAFDFTNGVSINIDTDYHFYKIDYADNYTVALCCKELANSTIQIVEFPL